MYVTDSWVGGEEYTPEASSDTMVQEKGQGSDQKARSNAIDQLRALAGLCNAGEFDASTAQLSLHKRKINGDATDQAILRFSESLGSVSALRLSWAKVFEVAFNSKNKFMVRVMAPVEGSAFRDILPYKEQRDFGSDGL
jgi:sodium/potassium-transporting ATPase subunit alpha